MPLPILFLVAAIAVVVIEQLLSRRAPYLLPELLNTGLGIRFRLLSLDVLTALLAARLLPDAGGIVALAIVAVLLLAAGRDAAGIFARRLQWRRAGGPVSWRNFDVPGIPTPRPTSEVPQLDLPFTLLGLLIPLGYAIGSLTDRFTAAIAAQWVTIAVVLVFLAVRFIQYRVLERPDDGVREAVRAAIDGLGPEVVLHHAGRAGTAEQVLLWIPALRALERPVLVVVREARTSTRSRAAACRWSGRRAARTSSCSWSPPSTWRSTPPTRRTSTTTCCACRASTTCSSGTATPTSRSRAAPRAHVRRGLGRRSGGPRPLRLPGERRARVEGEGDRADPPVRSCRATPRRPADGRLRADVGERGRRDRPLLAGHWGTRIVEALLARQDVRTLFVPAAPTGARLPAAAVAADAVRARIAAAGGDHATWPSARLRRRSHSPRSRWSTWRPS